MKEAFDKLFPIAFIICLIYPILQGSEAINVNCVNILKQQAQILNHKFFSGLWSQHAVIMFRDGRSGGPQIIFPMKSACRDAIMFRTHGIE